MVVIILILVILLSIWYVISQVQIRNVRAVIYWSNNSITYSNTFKYFSDFEEYHDLMYIEHGSSIIKISWEYADNDTIEE